MLERGTIALLATDKEKEIPTTLEKLLSRLSADIKEDICRYPWYGKLALGRELTFDMDDIKTATPALHKDMSDKNIQLLDINSSPLLAGEYNAMIDTMHNKARVLFHLAIGHIYRAWQQFGQQNLQIMIDRQGGRSHYRPLLQKMFPESKMKILKETETLSSYELTEGNRSMKLHFMTKGDSKHLPIALASMASKYLRELLMEILNEYFATLCPGLKPTAGYYQDGNRFLSEIATHKLDESLMPKKLLVRQK